MTKKEVAIELIGLVEKESRRCKFLMTPRSAPRVRRYAELRLRKMTVILDGLHIALND